MAFEHLIRRLFAGAVALYLFQWVLIIPPLCAFFVAEIWSISLTGHSLATGSVPTKVITETDATDASAFIAGLALVATTLFAWGFYGFTRNKPLPMGLMAVIAAAHGILSMHPAAREQAFASLAFSVAMAIATVLAVIDRVRTRRHQLDA